MTWYHKLRLRALAFVIGLAITAAGLISWLALPALPVIGVVFATAAVMLHNIGSRATGTSCLGCGHDLSSVRTGVHGSMCPECGLINQFRGRA
ncbi:MAG: hypothetical protein KF866_06850 [Phycisphaeraceae bacterium]|nr:hypothetical protein [Phycisphaeraceae bacterium]MCW5755428.1 hypothetical protein [Phycisphaeraceae bacterium]